MIANGLREVARALSGSYKKNIWISTGMHATGYGAGAGTLQRKHEGPFEFWHVPFYPNHGQTHESLA